MSIIDIGILTGFAPDQKSLQKVHILLLYLQRILDRFLRIVYLISALRGNSSSLANFTSTQSNPKPKMVVNFVGCFCDFPYPTTDTLPSETDHTPKFFGCVQILMMCRFAWCGRKRCRGNLLVISWKHFSQKKGIDIDLLASKKVVLGMLICWLLCAHALCPNNSRALIAAVWVMSVAFLL